MVSNVFLWSLAICLLARYHQIARESSVAVGVSAPASLCEALQLAGGQGRLWRRRLSICPSRKECSSHCLSAWCMDTEAWNMERTLGSTSSGSLDHGLEVSKRLNQSQGPLVHQVQSGDKHLAKPKDNAHQRLFLYPSTGRHVCVCQCKQCPKVIMQRQWLYGWGWLTS